MKRLPIVLVLIGLLSTGAPAAAEYSRTVTFGDSLSDPGNAYFLLRQVAVPPFDVIPSAPYARGGLHFSNGETWVEQLTARLGLAPSAGPAFQVPGVFSNYAVGGARARLDGFTDLAAQVNRFLGDFGVVTPPYALFVLQFGGNDIRDALEAFPTGGFGASIPILEAAVDAIEDSLRVLASSGAPWAGAVKFLVANAPNVGLAPAVRLIGASALATYFAAYFNARLEERLDDLEDELSVTILRLDLFGLVTQIVDTPEAFGLSDAEKPCLAFGTRVKPFCARPDQHLFWDGIHPTRAAHGILADQAHVLVDALY